MHSEHVHKLNTKLNTKTKRKAILQREMKNTGFLGVACRYFLRIIFSKILQINNNIPYLLAVPKKLFLV